MLSTSPQAIGMPPSCLDSSLDEKRKRGTAKQEVCRRRGRQGGPWRPLSLPCFLMGGGSRAKIAGGAEQVWTLATSFWQLHTRPPPSWDYNCTYFLVSDGTSLPGSSCGRGSPDTGEGGDCWKRTGRWLTQRQTRYPPACNGDSRPHAKCLRRPPYTHSPASERGAGGARGRQATPGDVHREGDTTKDPNC